MPINRLLREQQNLRPASAVEQFSAWHDNHDGLGPQPGAACATSYHPRHYQDLIPVGKPEAGEQFAFEVNLDACTGCKACVAACHSLNGLDDNESWRDIGALAGVAESGAPWQQTVTTACHHCVEPGCLQGCPTKAYEKDPISGIVRHLDDQCIGCQYCSLKCPYDVPKYNPRLGIVRKCDMCHQRLAVGEAPACVQSCPNGAIAIRIVKRSDAANRSEPVIEGAVPSTLTRPTTLYISAKPRPKQAAAPHADVPRVEHTHWPLVIMLVLTQWSFGTCVACLLAPSKALATTAAVIGLIGIHASILHLGQPLKAWKAFLGWRTSWLSREVMTFGGFAGALTGLAASVWIPQLAPYATQAALGACAAGAVGVFCSIMVYVDTHRAGWAMKWTLLRFGGTCAVLGSATLAAFDAGRWEWRVLTCAIVCAKLLAEWRMWKHFGQGPVGDSNRLSARAAWGPLKGDTGMRFSLALLALVVLIASPWVGLAMLLAAEGIERVLFFKAQHAPRMPGVV